MATRKCKWCGNHYKLGFVASNTMGLAGNTGYCSKKCQTADGGGQNSNNNTENINMSAEERILLEKEKMAHEVEMKKLQMEERKRRNEQEAKEEQQRKIKADEYRAKGKNFMAFLVGMNPIYLISIIVGILVCCFFGYKQISKTYKRNQRQEKIRSNQTLQETINSNVVEDKKDVSIRENKEKTPFENNILGVYRGGFGKDILVINIEKVENSNVIGYDEVKGNRRKLTGTIQSNTLVLNEPGDDKWDGVFDVTYSDNKLVGTWQSNNGKSTKKFTLEKQ